MLLYCLYVVMLYFTILPFDHLTGLYGYFSPKNGFYGENYPFSGLFTYVFRMRWCFYEGVTTVHTKESSKSLRRSQGGANGSAVRRTTDNRQLKTEGCGCENGYIPTIFKVMVKR